MSGAPVHTEAAVGGAVARVVLNAPKGNILDAAMLDGLSQAFRAAGDDPRCAAVVLAGAGGVFSYGASVQEHLPGEVEAMLRRLRSALQAMARCSLPIVAAVRGPCLGGGLEVAAFCHRIHAAPDARLGQPEIKLGVFAPAGSLLLAERCGPGVAADLCLSGRTVSADEARSLGLVDQVDEDPEATALAWIQEHLLPGSRSSLRLAVRALRRDFEKRFFAGLEELERLYLEDLMSTHDAAEGLRAFLEKRSPQWKHA